MPVMGGLRSLRNWVGTPRPSFGMVRVPSLQSMHFTVFDMERSSRLRRAGVQRGGAGPAVPAGAAAAGGAVAGGAGRARAHQHPLQVLRPGAPLLPDLSAGSCSGCHCPELIDRPLISKRPAVGNVSHDMGHGQHILHLAVHVCALQFKPDVCRPCANLSCRTL